MKIKKGDRVPSFALKDQNWQEVKTESFRGKKLILSFHPLSFTPVCSQQMKDLEKNNALFSKYNSVAVGINIDQPYAKAAWARMLKISHTRLLSDFWPHGKVAKQYGIFRKEGYSERAVFIIDERGKTLFAKIYPIRKLPDIKEIIGVLKKATLTSP